MRLPAAVPEIPVSDVDRSVEYYVRALGFTLDWGGHQGGIAGLSRGDCRLFLTSAAFRAGHGNTAPVLFWLNLDGRAEVDALFAEWLAAGATAVAEPQDQPWKLREFTVADPDGNRVRVFHDFGGDASDPRA